MIRILFNPGLARQVGTVTLGDVTYRIRAVWRERARGWYIDVYLADGTAVAEGLRLSSGGLLVRDLNRHDADAVAGGVLYCLGKDRYAREDLGQDGGINLYYFSRAEWDSVAWDTSEDVLITP